jgi:hypothetical protein
MKPTYLHVGGLVAAGFDRTGKYLLTVSHSGRGLFSADTWQRVARDAALAYPKGGTAIGIGPIEGQSVPIIEMNYETEQLILNSPDGQFRLEYESGTITVTSERA